MKSYRNSATMPFNELGNNVEFDIIQQQPIRPHEKDSFSDSVSKFNFEQDQFISQLNPEFLSKLNHIRSIIAPYHHAKSLQHKHPVLDFLFEYYSFSANKLLTFNPGFEQEMPSEWTPSDYRYTQFHQEQSIPDKIEQSDQSHDQLSITNSIAPWALRPSHFPTKRLRMIDWVLNLLEAIDSRPKAFGCYGLHEWAMVYRIDEVRHDQLNLRLPPAEIAHFVESHPIKCSHFDAYRFFTPEAQPLNQLQPTYDKRVEMEQGGCIHANMDLYKWTYKLHPWLGSDLLWDAFLLAHDTRYFDMQASPYDLSAYGLSAIPIETLEGRQMYVNGQKAIAERADVVRRNLISALKKMRSWATSPD